MKKLLIIALIMVGMTANAQGIWSMYELQADELIGEPGGKYIKFTNDTIGSVTIREGDDFWMQVESSNGNFYGIYDPNSVGIVQMLFGLYDGNGNLLVKYDGKIHGTEHTNFRSVWIDKDWAYFGQKPVLKKIIAGMKSGSGYARLVIHRVNMPDFDLKITPYNR